MKISLLSKGNEIQGKITYIEKQISAIDNAMKYNNSYVTIYPEYSDAFVSPETIKLDKVIFIPIREVYQNELAELQKELEEL